MSLKKLIFDCDPGNDDAVALIMAVLCGKYDILGVTVAHGNKPLEDTVDNALRLVDFLGAKIPVYAGCPSAMTRGLMPGRSQNVRSQRLHCVENGEEVTIHEAHLKLPAPVSRVQAQHACSFLVDTLRSATEKITVVATAPLTNVGMALRMAPEISEKIEQLVIMGGGIRGGNRTPAAEANFYDDPEAAQIVLHCGCPVLLFPLEATMSTMLSFAEVDSLQETSPVGRYVAESVHEYLRRGNLLHCSPEGFGTIHDAVAVAGMIDPSIIEEVHRAPCDVDCSGGWSDGKLVVDERISAKPVEPVDVVYRVNKEKYLTLLRDILKNG